LATVAPDFVVLLLRLFLRIFTLYLSPSSGTNQAGEDKGKKCDSMGGTTNAQQRKICACVGSGGGRLRTGSVSSTNM
jgi:hypothetical protein